ncbi:histidine phosphatase family protein [Bacillus sp. PS06]|uniref:histidine phosphatase family protein n=1 Tax=Bacillus sp. PS06 TaxID=2764176 RepID=UPI0017836161|nr:phosphoglycerate mutase family protein [Bacillus sp. PS06]MBD8068070.1 phosphoglycerate mutase family protein [Bacillus sp. PS06]
MEIAAIRHLPTEWNKKGVLQGSRNIPISPITNGFKHDIEVNKQKLINILPVDIVLTSSLIRTQQTAKSYGYESFQVEPLLDELNFGDYEGVPKSRLINDYSDVWMNSPRELTLGESLLDFEKRILSFIKEYKHYSKIIVFGHGSWMRGLISINQFGTINEMNKVVVKNNELLIVNF